MMRNKEMTVQHTVTGEGLRRLMSGEYPEAVVRDLRAQGLSLPELQILLDEAARRTRRRGLRRVAGGALLALLLAVAWLGAAEAGLVCSGPGLFVGLGVLLNGLVQLKNSRDLTQAARACGQGA